MNVEKTLKVRLASENDLVKARTETRNLAREMKMRLVAQTRIVTAVSEIARNALKYGGGGELTLSVFSEGRRRGLGVEVADSGPGIADLDQAMQDGYTTGGGLGLGMGGSRRLVDLFEVLPCEGSGVKVKMTVWLS